jgi:hypothetical protein
MRGRIHDRLLRRQASLGEGGGDLGLVGREPHVGEQGGDEPQAGTCPVDGADNRLGDQRRDDHGPPAGLVHGLPRAGDPVELLGVEAGAEGPAGAGDDDGPHVPVLARLLEQVVEGELQLQVPGVVALRTVEGQRQHPGFVHLGEDGGRLDTLHWHMAPAPDVAAEMR